MPSRVTAPRSTSVQPQQQVDRRRLARPRGSHQPQHLARRDAQREVTQHRLPWTVGELHARELHRAAQVAAQRPLRRGDLGPLVDRLEHALGRGERLHQALRHLPGPRQRLHQQHHVGGELHQLPHTQLAGQHQGAADQQHQQLAEAGGELHQRSHDAPDLLVAHVDHVLARGPVTVAGDLGLLAAERLDHADAGQHVVHQAADLVVQAVMGTLHPPRQPPHRHREQRRQRNGGDGKQRQQPVLGEGHGAQQREQQHLAHAVGGPALQEAAQVGGVRGHPVEHVPRRLGGDEAQRHRLHAGVDRLPQVEHQGRTEPCHAAVAQHQ